jgi:chaperone required for assembly of F1-ATPase
VTGTGPRKIPGREERTLIKRFYREVTFEQRGEGFAVLLDGRLVKTPSKAVLAVPSEKLAEAIAQEWRVQGDHIDPLAMPMTRLANTALDRVMGRENEIVAEMVQYAGSDMLCYRAEHPQMLVALQSQAWDPILAWAADEHGIRLALQEGLMPIAQPDESLARVRTLLASRDRYALTALHNMTTLTGSALLALAHGAGRIDAEEAWRLAHIDEDYQISQWGEDAEAMARRAVRWAEMEASARLLALVDGLPQT